MREVAEVWLTAFGELHILRWDEATRKDILKEIKHTMRAFGGQYLGRL